MDSVHGYSMVLFINCCCTLSVAVAGGLYLSSTRERIFPHTNKRSISLMIFLRFYLHSHARRPPPPKTITKNIRLLFS